VDNACPNLVSCADILTLAAEKSSVMVHVYKKSYFLDQHI
jgi:hypothetical protein